MATASFKVLLSISEVDFGKKISFKGKKIELWKKEDGYDELVGTFYTDRLANGNYKFDITESPSVIMPKIFIKIFDDSKVIPYKFEETGDDSATLTVGENVLTALIDLEDDVVGVNNDEVICNGLITDEEGEPYPFALFSVKATIVQADNIVQDLGELTTTPFGFFTYSFIKDKFLTTQMANNLASLSFKYQFYYDGALIGQYTKAFNTISDFENLLTIRINLTIPIRVVSKAVQSLASDLGISISSGLQTALDGLEITSLRDVRSKGGLSRALSGPVYTANQATADKLDAHAQLEMLSDDFAANNHIIEQGYTSIHKIAIASSAKFARDVVSYGTVSDFGSLKIHRIANAQTRLFQNVFMERKLDAKRKDGDTSIGNIISLIEDKCNCDECEAAISPIAYLADLFWYVKKKLSIIVTPASPPVFDFTDGAEVTEAMIKELFCQDFCISADQCDAINARLCQYRVAIETLNCFEGNPNECQEEKFKIAERNYLTTAYFTLLEQLGTTYYEVRDTKNSVNTAKKQELADKLGIPLNVILINDPEDEEDDEEALSTDLLYIDPYASYTDFYDDFNGALETIFGLRNYTKSCTYVQKVPYIQTWKEEYLKLQWKKEDANSDIYSLATMANPVLILDPDIVNIDDFRNPNMLSAPAAGSPQDIWLKRKEYLETIWNSVFIDSIYNTPVGGSRGINSITVTGNVVSIFQPGKRFTLSGSGSSANYRYYTVEKSVYDGGETETQIFVKEIFPDPATIVGKTINYYKKVAIVSFETDPSDPDDVVYTINVASAAGISVNDKIEVRGAGSNDAVYTVESISSNELTVSGHEFVDAGAIGYVYIVDGSLQVDAATVAPVQSVINVEGDITAELAGNLYVDFKSDIDEERYTIDTGVNFAPASSGLPFGNTTIPIEGLLRSDYNQGQITYYAKDYVTEITPEHANSKFILPLPIADNILEELVPGRKIVVVDTNNTGNLNNAEYTITAAVLLPNGPEDTPTDLHITVLETINNSTAVTDGLIKYSPKVKAITYSRPRLQSIFNQFKNNATFPEYSGTADAPWSGDVKISTFIEYRDNLLNGTPGDEGIYDNTLEIVEGDLRLTRDAFLVLANTAEKYQNEISGDSIERVTAEEYTQLFNILIFAAKNFYKTAWFAEEETNNIALNYNDFWLSITQPVEGVIDNSIVHTKVLIDPELIGLSKLPDMPAGKVAVGLWNERKDELEELTRVVKNTRVTYGFDAAVAFGLSLLTTYEDFVWTEFDELLLGINTLNTNEVKLTERIINEKLSISVEDFRFIMQLHQRTTLAPNSVQLPNPPSQEEYQKLYKILVSAYKRKILYPEWIAAENAAGFFNVATTSSVRTKNNNWKSTKAKLPKWRASLTERMEWQDALISRNAAPVIEPDLIFAEDFKNYSNAAYTLWAIRKGQVNTITNSIVATLDDADTIEIDISDALGMDDPTYNFDYLLDADNAGEDIRPRLKQIHITYQAFTRLKTLAAVTYDEMTPDEKNEFISILVQAEKIRGYYGIWRDVEASLSSNPMYSNTISVNPDYFKINKPVYGEDELNFYNKLDAWRATWKDRRAFEKKVAGRIEQFANVKTVLDNLIDEVENIALPIMRDALVMRCADEYATLQENARKLENRLLVDFSINCCQHVTRVSHAIDVLQKLLWTESVGIDKDIYLNDTTTLKFFLDAPHFQEEWQWMGSYSTWRAAMFVFMYPENLLLPSLRKHQTPAFRKLVNDIRSNNRLTPLDACRAAVEYGHYYDDITNLEPEASCSTSVRMHREECLTKTPVEEVDMFFMFATRKRNDKNDKEDERKQDVTMPKRKNYGYYQTKRYDGDTIDDYSFWTPIEGLGENVVRIVGTSVYQQDLNTRHLLLFAVVYEEIQFKLVFIKYDLEKQSWDTEFTELGMPKEDVDYASIRICICADEKVVPEIIYQGKEYRAVFMNRLNSKIKDWQYDEWIIIAPAGTTNAFATTINAYLTFWKNNFTLGSTETFHEYERMIIGTNTDGEISYKLVGRHDDLKWRKVLDISQPIPPSVKNRVGTDSFALYAPVIGTFRGAFNYDREMREVQLLFEQNSLMKQVVIKPSYIARHAPATEPSNMLLDTNVGTGKRTVKTFTDLDNWMMSVAGFGLSNIELRMEQMEALNNLKWAYEYRLEQEGTNDAYSIGYTHHVGNSPLYLDNWNGCSFKLLFQAFQNLWDEGIEATEHKTQGIRQKVNNANSWLSDKYIQKFNKDDYKAGDLKWLDQVFRGLSGNIIHYFSTSFNDGVPTLGTDTSLNKTANLKDIINALLNYTVASQYWGFSYAHLKFGYFLDTMDSNGYRRYEKWGLGAHYDNVRLANVLCLYVRTGDDFSPIVTLNKKFDFVRNYSGALNKMVALKNYANITGLYAAGTTLENITVSGKTNAYVKLVIDGSIGYRAALTVPKSLSAVTEELTTDELISRRTQIFATLLSHNYVFDKPILREYLEEPMYFVPMMLGIQLSQKGLHEAALKWFRTVYDYTQKDEGLRGIYRTLLIDINDAGPSWDRGVSWLADPLNPHRVARTRKDTYYRYTVSTIAQTFVAFADAQFTLDTVESVSKAKELYQFAADLMSLDEFKQKPDECFIDWDEERQKTICLIREVSTDVVIKYGPAIDAVFDAVKDKVKIPSDLTTHTVAIKGILTADVGTEDFDMDANLAGATTYLEGISVPASTFNLQNILNGANEQMDRVNAAVMSLEDTEHTAELIRNKVSVDLTRVVSNISAKSAEELQSKTLQLNWVKDAKKDYDFQFDDPDNVAMMRKKEFSFANVTSKGIEAISAGANPHAALDAVNSYPFPYVPIGLSMYPYCVPVNPTYQWLSMSIELNLFKIRNCLNIAGMKRDLDPYAAPTDLYSGLPQIGANGQIVLPGTSTIRPTLYRFKFLIERAKQMVAMAQQAESAFLSAATAEDQARYELLRAKQDLSLARATVKLKELQTKVSEAEVDLAIFTRERSEIQVQELDNMISAGLNEFEQQMIDMYYASAALQTASLALGFGSDLAWKAADSSTMDIASSIAKGTAYIAYSIMSAAKLGTDISNTFVQAGINVNSLRASQARREQEWTFQKTLATQDIKIGNQQVKIAQDRVRVSEQDRKISELQVTNAENTIDFLNNKFTNVDLYSFMSGVLSQVFSYYVSEATGLAKVAENQLAFERQETPAGIIQGDYWVSPNTNGGLDGGTGPDRRGITSSARLGMDLTKLEQYAMNTEQRRMQITKTFSLASFFPLEFQMFKETGEITFDTLMDYFDRDFPGHYLRLVKKVRVNVIALVPPAQGIHATLTSSGISHVVIGGNIYQDVIVRRSPEVIALSGSRESNGMFELQQMDNEFLNPFESTGVHGRWQLKMEKPANMFDYNSIADVLVTIDYTALSSYDYEKQVKSRLTDEFESERAYSFRNEFSDAFYQWTHPDEFGNNAKVSINVGKFDFPANVTDVLTQAIKFYVVTDQTDPQEIVFDNPTGKGVTVNLNNTGDKKAGFNNKGIISTKIGGGSLSTLVTKSPIGKWDITLDGLQDAFENGKVLDVIMVIAYSGSTPKWL